MIRCNLDEAQYGGRARQWPLSIMASGHQCATMPDQLVRVVDSQYRCKTTLPSLSSVRRLARTCAYVASVIMVVASSSEYSLAQERGGLGQLIAPLAEAATIDEHLSYINDQIAENLSYASSRFEKSGSIFVEEPILDLRSYLDILLEDYDKAYLERENKILIIVQGLKVVKDRHIYGYIRDGATGEVLAGAAIELSGDDQVVFTNNVGYYNIRIKGNRVRLLVQYFGYKSAAVVLNSKSTVQQDVNLTSSTVLSPVLISAASRSTAAAEHHTTIDLQQLSAFASITGEADLLNAVKTHPAVQSGSEGQGGYYVRGGSPDQNLILLDGVAMYEVSHTAGIASIFNVKGIRDVSLITEGFDARYGGRTSSVMDIHLKDGHYKQVLGSVDVGVFGGGVHLEGPLAEGKTAFNISAKTSWVNAFLDRYIPDDTQYDDIDLSYSDLTVKLSHRFSPVSRLSFTVYRGSDDVELLTQESQFEDILNNFEYEENNSLRWGSSVYALNYEQIVGDKWLLRAHLGYIDYDYRTSSFYNFDEFNAGLLDQRTLSVEASSGIQDWNGGVTGEYYLNSDHKITLGAGMIYHNNRPSIKTTNARDNELVSILQDSSQSYLTNELSLHVNDDLRLLPWLHVKSGLRLSVYATDNRTYSYIEPRLALAIYPDDKSTIRLSASRMTQNVHLLVNPGIGLPSDLWVPSTDEIAPEISDQFTIGVERLLPGNWRAKVMLYHKVQQNLLEYASAIDLFYSILNSNTVTPVDVQSQSWEDRVSIGRGTARGLELSLARSAGAFTGWATYTWSRADRQFDDINDGELFPYKYDRTHDINVGCRISLTQHLDMGITYTYGTGSAITLSLEEIVDPVTGQTILLPGPRNAYRLAPFHHLDVNFSYTKPLDNNGQIQINLGVYNIYNRFNPYYIYLYEDRLSGQRQFRQVSLFPLMPNLQVSYSF